MISSRTSAPSSDRVNRGYSCYNSWRCSTCQSQCWWISTVQSLSVSPLSSPCRTLLPLPKTEAGCIASLGLPQRWSASIHLCRTYSSRTLRPARKITAPLQSSSVQTAPLWQEAAERGPEAPAAKTAYFHQLPHQQGSGLKATLLLYACTSANLFSIFMLHRDSESSYWYANVLCNEIILILICILGQCRTLSQFFKCSKWYCVALTFSCKLQS